MEENCIDRALIAAVENGNHSNVAKLILRGASNIDKALEKSQRLRKNAVSAALLIIKAAMENDRILVLKLYGEDVQGLITKIPLSEENDLNELQQVVCNHTIKTVVPIEIARQSGASAVREELLLRTDVDKESGTVLWFGLCLKQLEISWLRKIHWVRKLNLAQNEFVTLPLEMGSYLKQCVKLDLQRNNIHEIPNCLLELPSINILDLSHNYIINIPDVPKWSPSLSLLDLSYNCLSSLPNSAVAPNLKNLDIGRNQFHIVPNCVCSFIGLTTLNIAFNTEILALPNELGRLKNLVNLNLDGINNLIYPPRSVRVTTADCIRYLNSKLRSSCGFYHMKLMVLGKCGSGKSTMVARLCDEQHSNETTTGIDVTEWKYSPSYNRKTFHFSIWDFASKEVYYATHQCFLSKRSLYLLVWNITEGDKGVDDLKPWLNNISMKVPDSCIIIVGTFLDTISEEDRRLGKTDVLLQRIEEIIKQYRRLVVTNITVVGLQGRMENVQKLKDYIYSAASEYKIKGQYVMGAKIPSSYHALYKKLVTKVKDGVHEPIMHAVEFEKMVRDLNLTDINDDDEELRTAVHFLHAVGALLHYDDRKNKLDKLYFVDPAWLCDLMSTTVVTAKIKNPDVKQAILRSKDFSLLFKDKRFPTKYFQQYLTLLSKFEIALPLDKDNQRMLIPSMLPKIRPAVMSEQLQGDKDCYTRLIIFHGGGQSYCCPTPPGLWSRPLSRIMNNIEEVKSIISEQMPFEEGGNLVYWCTGLFCNINKLTFSIEALEEIRKHQDRNGIFIMCSPTAAGHRIFGELIDLIEHLISEWYPGLVSELEHKVPCFLCARSGISDPYEFKVDHLLSLIADNKMSIMCGTCNKVLQLINIVPDLFLTDFDAAFLLDASEVIYEKTKENLLGIGAFGEVYRGKYKGQSVAIKLYNDHDRVVGFKELRLESKILQKLHHPCLVCMVGVTIHPTMSLSTRRGSSRDTTGSITKRTKSIFKNCSVSYCYSSGICATFPSQH